MRKILLIFSLVFSVHLYAQNTIKDIEGNIYKTLKIDTIEWMIENLKTTRFNNGDKILLKDSSTIDVTKYRWEIGKHQLYSWHVLKDERGVCPTGWRIPSDSDFKHTIDFIFNDSNSKLPEGKNTNFIYRENIDLNTSLFTTGLDFSGSKTSNGLLLFKNYYEYFWTISEDYTGFAWMWYFSKDAISHYNFEQKGGLSVRCVKHLK
jgi:uncharacterized protein (TIGR02145 family)